MAGSFVLRILALRQELGWPLQVRRAASAWALAAVVHHLAALLPAAQAPWVLSALMLAAGALVLARHAVAVGQLLDARIGHGLAAAESLLALAIGLRTAAGLAGWAPADGAANSWDLALAVVLAVVTALFGNLGYLGLVLGRSRAAERAAVEAQWTERLRREAAEDRAASLRDLLLQRDELAAERDRLLGLLAHEIRQPLLSAGLAMQGAVQVLRDPHSASAAQVGAQLMQAQTVLGDVRSVLDNTLAAATLLSRGTPLVRQDVALDFLVELTLGDLGARQLERLTVDWRTDIDSLEVEPGLVRLALRNLLTNAFVHGGPQVNVPLTIDTPPHGGGWRLVVSDDGPGIAPAQ